MRFAYHLVTLPGILCCAFVAMAPAQAQSTWHLEKTMQVGGAGGDDDITVDSLPVVFMSLAAPTRWSSMPLPARLSLVTFRARRSPTASLLYQG